MYKIVRFLALIGVAVAAPLSQEEQQQVQIPFGIGQNGVLALIPIDALGGQFATRQSQQQFLLPSQGSSLLNGSPVFLMRQPFPFGQQQVPVAFNVPSNVAPAAPASVAVSQAPVKVPAPAAPAPAPVVVVAPAAPASVAVSQAPVKVPAPAAPAPAPAPVVVVAPAPAPAPVAPAPKATVVLPAAATATKVGAASVDAAKISSVDSNVNSDYRFTYVVNDPVTGDAKTVSENRQGDKITGSYVVNDPDGIKRTVTYEADPVNGFQAKVTTQETGIVPPAPAVVAAKSIKGGMNPGASASAQVNMPSASWGWNSATA